MPRGSFKQVLAFYAFVVLMILLRPYSAYKISSRGGFANDPEAITRILNRLVKKKETHIDDMDEAMELSQSGNIEIILPVAILLFFRRNLIRLADLLFGPKESLFYSTVFQVRPDNAFYQRTSRLRI